MTCDRFSRFRLQRNDDGFCLILLGTEEKIKRHTYGLSMAGISTRQTIPLPRHHDTKKEPKLIALSQERVNVYPGYDYVLK